MLKSFAAKVTAREGVLLGGVKSVTSSRFERFEHAVRWSDQTILANQDAGRHPMHDGIWGFVLEPEILAAEIEDGEPMPGAPASPA